MSHRIFVTGTDTDVGKTYVAAQMTRQRVAGGMTVGVYKPVASGCRPDNDRFGIDGRLVADDAVMLWEAAGRPRTIEDVCPQKFTAALAPHLAAAAEDKKVDASRLLSGLDVWTDFETIVIEGAGGLYSPIADNLLNIDLIEAIKPDEIVLVAKNRIGVAHQVLVCLAAASSRGLSIGNVILNSVDERPDESIATNRTMLQQFAPHLAVQTIDHGGTF